MNIGFMSLFGSRDDKLSQGLFMNNNQEINLDFDSMFKPSPFLGLGNQDGGE